MRSVADNTNYARTLELRQMSIRLQQVKLRKFI